MKCVICKNGETSPARVTVALDLPTGGTVVFQGVPANVCDNCGERYFDETTTGELLRQSKALSPPKTAVEVLPYAAA